MQLPLFSKHRVAPSKLAVSYELPNLSTKVKLYVVFVFFLNRKLESRIRTGLTSTCKHSKQFLQRYLPELCPFHYRSTVRSIRALYNTAT